MTLSPTNVTIDGCRVWLQDATDATLEHVNYRAAFGLHIETRTDMPKAERIDTHGTTARKQEPAQDA